MRSVSPSPAPKPKAHMPCAHRIYSNGQSEIEMGRVFKELEIKREELVIITKVRSPRFSDAR